MAGAVLGPAEHLVADPERVHADPDFAHHARQIRPLARGEGSGPALVELPLADRDFTRIDPGRLDCDDHAARAGRRVLDFSHLEHVHAAISVEPHRPHATPRPWEYRAGSSVTR